MKYFKIQLSLLLLSFLIGMISCKRPDKIIDRSGIVNISLTSDVSSLDPVNSYDVVSGTVLYQIYETLFEYHYLKRPYTLIPLLAKSMPTIQKDGSRYIIKIKKNVRYHDNPCFQGKIQYVKAQDFINQIKRLAFIPTKSNGWWLFDGKIVGLNKFREMAGTDFKLFQSLEVEGLKAPDDHTLIVDLIRPTPQLLFSLAMSHTSPIPTEAITYYQNDFSQQDLGTGPFALKKWNPGLSIVLSKFKNYRNAYYPSTGDRFSNDRNLLKDAGKKIPFLNEIHFHIIKEAQTRWLNFLSRKIDLIDNIPKDNFNMAITPLATLSEDLKEKKIHLEIAPTLTYWWLAFNMEDPLIGKNKSLRFAIAHAIDMDKYIRVFTHNIGLQANSIYPPGIPGYDPSHHLNYTYDLEKAKKFLKEAGYPNGKNLPEIIFDVRGNDTTQRQQAEFVKAELEKIGIKIRVTLNSFPGFLQKSRSGNLQFWQGGWALDYPDSENILQLLITQNAPPGPNANAYSNKKFDELFNLLKIKENGKEKYEIMKQMEDIVLADLPWIMNYYSRNYILYYDYLKNYRYSDLVFNNFKYLKVSRK